jgi:invasion protein IalB
MKHFLTAFVLMMAGSTGALAQTEKKAPAPAAPEPMSVQLPAQGWVVNCATATEGLVCKASQSIVVAQSGQLLVAVSVAKLNGTAGYAMSLLLPHGIFLPAGTSVQIDAESAQAVVIESCDQRGCYANLPITEKVLTAMRKGKALAVMFQNLAKDNVKIQLPLAGFPDAIKKL